MSNPVTIEERLRLLCADVCGLHPEEIRPKRRFIECGLDSVRAMELMGRVEESFSLDIPDEHVFRLKTFHDLTSYVCARLEQGSDD
jgi:acyl carrier protein